MLIIALLILWIGGISARLVHLQVNQHEWLKARAESQRIDIKQTKMPRGSILDRNGRALAISVKVRTLYADATEIENVEKAADEIAPVLKLDRQKLVQQLTEAKDLERKFVPLVKGLDENKVHAINTELETSGLRKSDLPKYPGLHWRDEQARSYPNQTLAAHVIGFSNAEGVGQAGIEQSQNDVLYGSVIRREQQRDRLGRVYDETVSEKEPPKDVVLTISSSIQYKAEAALERAVTASAARAGMAIVIDNRTGEILALANYPTFDPNKLDTITSENLPNRCVQSVYAPGSVFKLLTYSSAFEANVLSPEAMIDSGNGSIEVAGHRFTDSHAIGSVTATKAFAHSSNVCAIKTSMKAGKENFYRAILKFGFGTRTGVELPAETAGIVRPPAKWYGDSMASMSIGYEIGVSALQMATAFATIANNGVRVKPHIIKEIRHSDETTAFVPQVEKEQVVSSKTAVGMKTLMEAVVTGGTGRRAQLNAHTSAGKTGTAWKFDEQTKRVSSSKYVSSFIGFAPVENPAVTIAVVIDEPRIGGRNGGQVAAPAFKEIADSVLTEMRVPSDLVAQGPAPEDREIEESVGDGESSTQPDERKKETNGATPDSKPTAKDNIDPKRHRPGDIKEIPKAKEKFKT